MDEGLKYVVLALTDGGGMVGFGASRGIFEKPDGRHNNANGNPYPGGRGDGKKAQESNDSNKSKGRRG